MKAGSCNLGVESRAGQGRAGLGSPEGWQGQEVGRINRQPGMRLERQGGTVLSGETRNG